jgi:hypothetical protein
MDDFDLFWSHYPKKKAKGDARKAWHQTEGIRPRIEVLIAAVERGKSSIDWHKCDREGNAGAYIPLPASYLRQERWDDEYKVSLSSIKATVVQSSPAPAPIVKPSEAQVAAVRQAIGAVLHRVA